MATKPALKKYDKHTLPDEQLSLDLHGPSEIKVPEHTSIVYSHLLPAKPTVVFDTYW